ncbi:flippase [Methanobacterium sp.]|uniref:flippase n=1 Tax=Methanobacterium sp. TaxID=2164 RepID=UPI002ABCA7DC|nr:flippase [Methanobacterium sp.]MDY9922725.1 flippase [Methanobacterium sp.]
MNTINRIVKNTTLLFASTVLSYILLFFVNMYTARYLGVGGFGTLSLAFAFTGIFVVFVDLGLSTLLVREVARDKSLANKYLGNIIVIKIVLSFITFGFIVIFVNLIGYSQEVSNIIYIVSVSTIIGSFNALFYSVFQAYEKMGYQSIGAVLNSFLLFSLILTIINYGLDIVTFSLIYIVVNLISLFYCFLICFWKFIWPKIEIDLSFWKTTIITALPLSLAVLFSVIGFRIDSVLLSIMNGNIAVGFYTAPYRLIEALIVIPSVFTLAIYPVISNFYVSSHETLENSYKISIKYLTIIGLPIAVGITLLADEIILLIYGNGFSQSILALQILSWEIPLIFLTYTFGTFLVSIDKQIISLKITFIAMIVNIILNLLLIPYFSYLAASFVTVITELVAFIFCFSYLSKFIIKINIIKFIIKPAVASLIMGLFMLCFNINLFLLIIISTILYLVILVILKTFSDEDIQLLRQILHKVKK